MALTDPTGGRKVGLRRRRHRGPNVLAVVPAGVEATPAAVELAEVDGTVISVPALERPRVVPDPDPPATVATTAGPPGADAAESTLEFNVREFREAAKRSSVPEARQPARRPWSDRYARGLLVTDLL